MRVLKTHIENALESLMANRMRTFLTMLGVMIGIASITVIFALSGGINSLIVSQVNNEGGAISVIRPKDSTINDKSILSTFTTSKTFTKSSLSEQDHEAISRLDGVVASSPLASFTSDLRAENRTLNRHVLATTPSLEKVISLKIKEGQFLAESANAQNVVIGPQLAVDLFGTEQVVGRTLTIKSQSFLIIGVLQKQKTAFNFSNIDFDNIAIINYNNAKSITNSNLQIQQINNKIDSINKLGPLEEKINKTLLDLHKGEQDFDILSGDKISHPSSRLIEAGSLVLGLVASISLIVGGIGIMNIMLVNVSERTREIGIRKALGANNLQILLQFLTESLIISLSGGLFGFLLGYSFSLGLSALLPFKPLVSWQLASLIISLSIIVGVFFGLYPAARAARKDPIESLRHYT